MAHDSGFPAAVRRLMTSLRSCCLGFLCLLTAALPLCEAIAQAPQNREPVLIRMFITAPEYADAIHTLIDQYHALNPNVTIVYETAQSDYPALLKTRINAGECPDIFATTSGKEVALYQDFSYDLTGTPAAAALPETSLRVLSANGRVYAFNIVNNYFGILYNRAIFSECGIAEFPATLDALETACETIAAHGQPQRGNQKQGHAPKGSTDIRRAWPFHTPRVPAGYWLPDPEMRARLRTRGSTRP